jgi:hypothetical protein
VSLLKNAQDASFAGDTRKSSHAGGDGGVTVESCRGERRGWVVR